MNDDTFTNLRGLACTLNLPAPWLAEAADAGTIPCLRIGRKRRFNVAAVRVALAARAATERIDAEARRVEVSAHA